jgi:hypothetical protein
MSKTSYAKIMWRVLYSHSHMENIIAKKKG